MKRGTIGAIDQIDAANLKERFGLED